MSLDPRIEAAAEAIRNSIYGDSTYMARVALAAADKAETIPAVQEPDAADIPSAIATVLEDLEHDLGWLGAQGNTVDGNAWAGISACRSIIRDRAKALRESTK